MQSIQQTKYKLLILRQLWLLRVLACVPFSQEQQLGHLMSPFSLHSKHLLSNPSSSSNTFLLPLQCQQGANLKSAQLSQTKPGFVLGNPSRIFPSSPTSNKCLITFFSPRAHCNSFLYSASIETSLSSIHILNPLRIIRTALQSSNVLLTPLRLVKYTTTRSSASGNLNGVPKSESTFINFEFPCFALDDWTDSSVADFAIDEDFDCVSKRPHIFLTILPRIELELELDFDFAESSDISLREPERSSV
ncbi:hypothetical protein Ahy_A10g046986 [Arachis hypogaea]|uniref:Uncharacterized protein n=1 Tax=Arachis hypogaea TaxID=3818 RepID=A0A445B160_ARAHY|nr:hypothetical protein Ahy_A10g046986 [Arachis hypogaea]